MKKFTITIINNDTKEVQLKRETNAVIGGLDVEGGSAGIGLTSGSAVEIAVAILAAKKAMKKLLKENPEIMFLTQILEKIQKEHDKKSEE